MKSRSRPGLTSRGMNCCHDSEPASLRCQETSEEVEAPENFTGSKDHGIGPARRGSTCSKQRPSSGPAEIPARPASHQHSFGERQREVSGSNQNRLRGQDGQSQTGYGASPPSRQSLSRKWRRHLRTELALAGSWYGKTLYKIWEVHRANA